MKRYKTIFKVFIVTEDQKEADWLREMSLKGYHLVGITGVIGYRFEIGEPKDYTYLIDYKGWGFSRDLEYREFFEDAGFKYITDLMQYYYFRIETNNDAMKMVKGEKQRRIEKYHQLSGSILAIGIMNLMIYCINMGIGHNTGIVFFTQINLICAIALGIISMLLKLKASRSIQEEGESKAFTRYEKFAKLTMLIVVIGILIAVVSVLCFNF